MDKFTASTKELIPFFKKLSTDLENGSLSLEEMRTAGELYMYYAYITENRGKNISDEDIRRFVFTGWFVQRGMDDAIDETP